MDEMKDEERILGVVKAVCISPAKGTEKRPVEKGRFIEGYGIADDAHAGKWHRQVSLLSSDKVLAFNEKGAAVRDGDFGENLLVEGIDFRALPVGTILRAGEVALRMLAERLPGLHAAGRTVPKTATILRGPRRFPVAA
jgi:MOSC domain-containing protein YiiM